MAQVLPPAAARGRAAAMAPEADGQRDTDRGAPALPPRAAGTIMKSPGAGRRRRRGGAQSWPRARAGADADGCAELASRPDGQVRPPRR